MAAFNVVMPCSDRARATEAVCWSAASKGAAVKRLNKMVVTRAVACREAARAEVLVNCLHETIS